MRPGEVVEKLMVQLRASLIRRLLPARRWSCAPSCVRR